jgi:hypothetical protein
MFFHDRSSKSRLGFDRVKRFFIAKTRKDEIAKGRQNGLVMSHAKENVTAKARRARRRKDHEV